MLFSAMMLGFTGPGSTWDNEMNFGLKHAPGAGLIAPPVDLQSSMLRLCYHILLSYVYSMSEMREIPVVFFQEG